MGSFFRKNNNNEKGEKILAFFTLQKVFFIVSVVFLIIAISYTYTLSIEEKVSKVNALKSLESFEEIVLQEEINRLQKKTETFEPESDIDTSYAMKDYEEGINSNKIQQITYLPKAQPEIEYESIAKLSIEKIDLEIMVLSEWSYELLDLSINKFSGPKPNESGNFIIIGHNYSNGKHFGNLDLLGIEDLIELTDLSGRKIIYEVYEIIIIKPTEVEKLKTVDRRTLTLITCDSNRNLRLVVKASSMD